MRAGRPRSITRAHTLTDGKARNLRIQAAAHSVRGPWSNYVNEVAGGGPGFPYYFPDGEELTLTVGERMDTVNLPKAIGGVGNLTYSWTPEQPAGLELLQGPRTPSGAVPYIQLKGTPTEAQARTAYTYAATDSVADAATLTYYITIASAGAPGRVEAPTLSAGDGTLDVTWTAPEDAGTSALTGYGVRYKSTAGHVEAWTAHDHSGTDAATTIAGLDNGTEYEVRVRAVNDSGGGAWSAAATATPAADSGLSARTLGAVAAADCETTDIWCTTLTAGADGGVSYGYSDVLTIVFGSVGSNRLSLGEAMLSVNQLYWFELETELILSFGRALTADEADQIKAFDLHIGSETYALTEAVETTVDGMSTLALAVTNNPFASGSSYTVRLTDTTTTTKPEAPADLTATGGAAEVVLSWTAAADGGSAITRHEYRQKAGSAAYGTWTSIADSAPGGANATSYTVTDLNNGTVYSFKVRAVNVVGEGAASEEDSATYKAVLPGLETLRLAGVSAAPTADCGAGNPLHGRTQAVVERIVGAIAGVTDCASVTNAQIAAITELSINDAGVTGLRSGDFAGLSRLAWLDMEVNGLTTLPEGVFAGLSGLKWLYLEDNDLTTLPEGVFAGLSGLEELDLANNSLTTLPEGVFAGLSRLRWLYLNNNSLTTLPEGVFAGLSRLAWLDLANNSLTTLPEGVFAGLSRLAVLYLYANKLTTLPEEVFAGLSGLEGLDLAKNSLTTLPEEVFAGLSGLRWLYLDNTPMGDLPPSWFSVQGLSSLEVLVFGTSSPKTETLTAYQAVLPKLEMLLLAGFSAAPTAPSAPSGLAAAVGNRQVTLSWTAGDDGGSAITGHKYQQKEGSGSYGEWTAIADSAPKGANATSYTVTGLTNGTQYSFKVRAVNAVGDGAASGEDSATPMVVVDSAPSFASAEVADSIYTVDTTIEALTLPAATDGNGDLTYSLSPALPAGLAFDAASRTLSGTPTLSLRSATEYTYTVSDSDANTEASDTDMLTFKLSIAPAAVVLSATPGPNAGEITLSWPKPADTGISDWVVSLTRFGTDGLGIPARDITETTEGGTPTLQYTRTALLDGKAFNLRIQAAAYAVRGPWSNYINEVAGGGPGFPYYFPDGEELTLTVGERMDTVNLAQAIGGDGELTYSWTPAPPAGLELLQGPRTPSGAVPYIQLKGTPEEAQTRTAYTYAATDTVADAATLTYYITIAGPAGSPGRVEAPTLSAGDGTLDVTWTAPEDAGSSALTGYGVRYKSTAVEAWTTHDHSGTDAATTITGLENGTEYEVRVRAVNDSGTGAWSPSAAAAAAVEVAARTSGNATVAAQRYVVGTPIIALTLPAAPGDNGDFTYSLTPALTGTGLSFEATGRVLRGTPTTSQVATRYSYTAAPDEATLSFNIEIAPAKPANLTATAGATQVALSWDAGDSGIDGWQIRQSTDGVTNWGNWTSIAGSSATTTGHSVTGLTKGPVYSFRIRAVTGSGNATVYSAESDRVVSDSASVTSAQVSEDLALTSVANQSYPARTAITSLTLPAASGGTAPLTYSLTPPSTRDDLPEGLSFDPDTRTLSGTPARSQLLEASPPARNYVYTVTDSATPPASATANFEITIVPAKPTNFTATSYGALVTLTWDVDEPYDHGIAGWQLRQSADDGENWSDWDGESIETSNVNMSHIVTGLTIDTTYKFQLSAYVGTFPTTSVAGAAAESSATPTALVSNQAPVILDSRNFEAGPSANWWVEEGVTDLCESCLIAVDADGDATTWTLTGADADLFTVSNEADETNGNVTVAAGRELDFETAPGYEELYGAMYAIYNFTAVLSDGTETDTLAIKLTVVDVDDDGTVSFDSTSVVVGRELTASLSDPDGGETNITWQWLSSATADGTFTDISESTAAAYTPVAGDVGSYLRATASYTDAFGAGKSASAGTENAVVATAPPNRDPVIDGDAVVTLEVAENTTTAFKTFTATDDDGDTLAWSLEGADAASFTISGGAVSVASGTTLDFESGALRYFDVKASDRTAADTVAVTVNVTNVDEAGTVSFDSDDPAVGVELRAMLTDLDGQVSGVTWQWASSATRDGSFNNITGATAVAYTPEAGDVGKYLRATASYTDPQGSGKTAQAETAAAVVQPNRAPVIEVDGTAVSPTLAISRPENTDDFTNYVFTATDAEGDDIAWTLDGTDKDFFTFAAATGLLSVASGKVLDYETRIIYVITLTASDATAASTVTVTVTVTNVDEPGAVSFGSATPEENTALTATLSDPDGAVSSVTWQWASAPSGNGSFTDIGGASGASYTPKLADVGSVLRATASYDDPLSESGSDKKTASAVTASAVAAGPDISPSFGDATIGSPIYTVGDATSPWALPDATGGNGDLTYSLTPLLPAGLSFAPATRMLSGTPTRSQLSVEYTYTVTDSDGSEPDSAELTFHIGIRPAKAPMPTAEAGDGEVTLSWTKPDDDGISGWYYRAASLGTDELLVVTDTTSGNVTTQSATIGDLVNNTEYSFRIIPYSGDSSSPGTTILGEASESVSVTPTDATASLSFGSAMVDSKTWTVDTAISAFTVPPASGGSGTVTYAATGLPTGVSMSSAREVSGTPSATGSGTATVTATDEANTATLTFTWTVSSATTCGGADIWCTTLTAGADEIDVSYGYYSLSSSPGSEFGSVGDNTFDLADSMFSVSELYWFKLGTELNLSVDQLSLSSDVQAQIQALDLHIGDKTFALAEATVADFSNKSTLTLAVTDNPFVSGQTYTVRLTDTTTATVPEAPTGLTATGGTGEVTLLWTAGDDGGSAVTGHEYQQVAEGRDEWTAIADSAPGDANARSYTVSGLTSDTPYRFTVRAVNVVGEGAASGEASAPTTANRAPVFSDESTTREVAENTATRTGFGAVVTATDADGDPLIYSLSGADADSFGIIGASGQVQTKAALNFESQASYTVTVTAADASNATASIEVTITVTNEDEAGTVRFGSTRPEVGTALTALLSDPDGGATDMAWQWASATASAGPFAEISGATTAAYTPVAGDAGAYLRATATYADASSEADSAARTASAVTANAVAAMPAARTCGSGDIWCTTLTAGVDAAAVSYGYDGSQPLGSIDSGHFSLPGSAFSVEALYWFKYDTTLIWSFETLLSSTEQERIGSLALHIGDRTFALDEASWLNQGGFSELQLSVAANPFNPFASGWTYTVRLTDTTTATVPTAPTGLTATGGAGEVTLSWTAGADGGSAITRHEYQQQAGSEAYGEWAPIADSAPGEANATSYTVSSLSNDTIYSFKVRAVNAVGAGAASEADSATPMVVVDSAPSFAGAEIADQTYVVGTAVDLGALPAATGGNGALTYSLSPTLPAGLAFDAASRTLSGTTPAISLRKATEYTYTVSDSDANTEASDTDTLTFELRIAPAAVVLTATPGPGADEITLSWPKPADTGISDWIVSLTRFGTSGLGIHASLLTETMENGTPTLHYTRTRLTEGKAYNLRIQAAAYAVRGPWSNYINEVAGGGPGIPLLLP